MIKICDLFKIIENGKFSIDLVQMCLTEEETNLEQIINVYKKANKILERYNKLRTFLEEQLKITWKTSNYYNQWKETEQMFCQISENLKNRKKTFQIYSIQLVNEIIKQDIDIEKLDFIQNVDLKLQDRNHICALSDLSYELDEEFLIDEEFVIDEEQNHEEIQQLEEGNQNQEQFENLQKEKEIEAIVIDSEEEDEKKERKEIKNEQQLQDQINKTQQDNDILNNHKETIQKKQKLNDNNYISINQQIHDISSDDIRSCEIDSQTEHDITQEDSTSLFYSTIANTDELEKIKLINIQDKIDFLNKTAKFLNININIKVLDVLININPECFCFDVEFEDEEINLYGFSNKVKIDMMNIKETDFGQIIYYTDILTKIENIAVEKLLSNTFITFVHTDKFEYEHGQILSQLLVLSHFQKDFTEGHLNGFDDDEENRLTIISDLNSIAISKSNYLLFVQNLQSITSLSLIVMQKVNLQKELLGNLKAYVYDLFDL